MRAGLYGIHYVEILDEPGDGTMMIRSIGGEHIGDRYNDGTYEPASQIIVCASDVDEDLDTRPLVGRDHVQNRPSCSL